MGRKMLLEPWKGGKCDGELVMCNKSEEKTISYGEKKLLGRQKSHSW